MGAFLTLFQRAARLPNDVMSAFRELAERTERKLLEAEEGRKEGQE
jgi:hypothetical protein